AGDDTCGLLWLFRPVAWLKFVLAVHSHWLAYIGGPKSDCGRWHLNYDDLRTYQLLHFRTCLGPSSHRGTSWKRNWREFDHPVHNSCGNWLCDWATQACLEEGVWVMKTGEL